MSVFPLCGCLAFRKPWGKPLLLKTLAVLLGYVSWACSLGIANSRAWRVWEFNSTVISTMYIGLWESTYEETVSREGAGVKVTVRTTLNSNWGIPNEIYYGQDLMLLANFLAPVALVFGTLAVWAGWMCAPYPRFFRICYNIAALHLSLTCFCLTLTVGWNFIVDLFSHTTLKFPPEFPVSKDMIRSKRVSYVLPLGLLACSFSFAGAVLFILDGYSKDDDDDDTPKLSMAKM